MNQIVSKIGTDNAAYLCWFVGSLLWNLGFIFPSEHQIAIHTSNLSRGLGLCIVNCTGLYWTQLFTTQPSTHKQLNKKQLMYVSLRHLLLGIYGYGFGESHFYLPSPVLYTIFFSGPLFVMLLEYFFYGITLSERQLRGVILTGIGVLLTANGQLIWGWITNNNTFETNFHNYKTQSVFIKTLVALALIILTFGWACAVLLVRQIKGCSHWSLNFNFGYILTSVSAFVYILHPDEVVANNPRLFAECLFKQGLVIAAAQAFFMVSLLLTKKSGTVCMVGFISVVFSYFLSVIRYNQPLNILCIIGSIFALVGIYGIVIK